MKPNHLAFPVACMAVEFSKPFEQGAVKEFVKSSEKLSKQFIY